MATTTSKPEPTFFKRPADFRKWLQRHHASAGELLVGYWKTGSGEPSKTWPESVDEALCFGWIDGARKQNPAAWKFFNMHGVIPQGRMLVGRQREEG